MTFGHFRSSTTMVKSCLFGSRYVSVGDPDYGASNAITRELIRRLKTYLSIVSEVRNMFSVALMYIQYYDVMIQLLT